MYTAIITTTIFSVRLAGCSKLIEGVKSCDSNNHKKLYRKFVLINNKKIDKRLEVINDLKTYKSSSC